MVKPTIFIGSSSEQLATAHALAKWLEPFSRPTVWDSAAFELNDSIFDALLKTAQVTDYAVFVFHPDDVTRLRGVESATVRDNVLFEFGLFTGRLGKGRTFWISCKDEDRSRLPADLVGILHLSYEAPDTASDAQLANALREPARRLGDIVASRGRRDDHAVEELDSVRILCVASSAYAQPEFAKDIQQIKEYFPAGIESAHGVTGPQLYKLLSRDWDIIHMAVYVDPVSGDLLLPDPSSAAGKPSTISRDGAVDLIMRAEPKLVTVVTCDSLRLGAEIARRTNVIAGHKTIAVRHALSWSSVFYGELSQGCPLSEAFNRAQAMADPGLLILSKRDFRLTLPPLSSLAPVTGPVAGS